MTHMLMSIGGVQLFELFGGMAAIIGIVMGVRNRVAYEVEKRTREAAEDLAKLHEYRAKELGRQLDDQRSEKHKALNLLAAEKLKTDLSIVLKTLAIQHNETQKLLTSIVETQAQQADILSSLVERKAAA